MAQIIGVRVERLVNSPRRSAWMILLVAPQQSSSVADVRVQARPGCWAHRQEAERVIERERVRLPIKLWAELVGVLLVIPTLVVVPLSFTDKRSFRFPIDGWSCSGTKSSSLTTVG